MQPGYLLCSHQNCHRIGDIVLARCPGATAVYELWTPYGQVGPDLVRLLGEQPLLSHQQFISQDDQQEDMSCSACLY